MHTASAKHVKKQTFEDILYATSRHMDGLQEDVSPIKTAMKKEPE